MCKFWRTPRLHSVVSTLRIPLPTGLMRSPYVTRHSSTSSATALMLFVSTVLLASLAACADSDRESGVPEIALESGKVASPMDATFSAAPSASRMASADASGGGDQLPGSAVAQEVTPSSMIIRNGSASIEVDSLEVAVDAVKHLAQALGGYIGNVSTFAGEYQVRSSTLELKIPANRFDEAMNGLTPIGKVESSNTTAEDVGEEFVDITARVTTQRRLEDRLVSLLATRTGQLEDVLAVERELARVRETIERYEGRLRYLKSRVATSTLSITVHEKAPLVGPSPGRNVLGEAFANMWRNFVNFIARLIESLGVVIPALILLAGVVYGWRRWRRPPASAKP